MISYSLILVKIPIYFLLGIIYYKRNILFSPKGAECYEII